MKQKIITYTIHGKKNKIKVNLMDTPWKKFCGLMFKKSSPPLLFTFNSPRKLTIHSLFCRPFRAIWLDENMSATKIIDVKDWKLSLSGNGKYLLEIPAETP